MSKQKQLIRIACAAAFVALAPGAWAQADIKIGYNSDMSASGSADFGVSALSGARQAAEEINAAGWAASWSSCRATTWVRRPSRSRTPTNSWTTRRSWQCWVG
jgi:hypothetical protein